MKVVVSQWGFFGYPAFKFRYLQQNLSALNIFSLKIDGILDVFRSYWSLISGGGKIKGIVANVHASQRNSKENCINNRKVKWNRMQNNTGRRLHSCWITTTPGARRMRASFSLHTIITRDSVSHHSDHTL